jgi:hypothetical protein
MKNDKQGTLPTKWYIVSETRLAQLNEDCYIDPEFLTEVRSHPIENELLIEEEKVKRILKRIDEASELTPEFCDEIERIHRSIINNIIDPDKTPYTDDVCEWCRKRYPVGANERYYQVVLFGDELHMICGDCYDHLNESHPEGTEKKLTGIEILEQLYKEYDDELKGSATSTTPRDYLEARCDALDRAIQEILKSPYHNREKG